MGASQTVIFEYSIKILLRGQDRLPFEEKGALQAQALQAKAEEFACVACPYRQDQPQLFAYWPLLYANSRIAGAG